MVGEVLGQLPDSTQSITDTFSPYKFKVQRSKINRTQKGQTCSLSGPSLPKDRETEAVGKGKSLI